MQLNVQEIGLNIKMSNGLYNGNNELPKMTRSEYVEEYNDIIKYYEQLRAEEKKFLPFYMAATLIAVVFIIYCICTKNVVGIFIMGLFMLPFNHRHRRFLRHSGLTTKEIWEVAGLLFSFVFPLIGYAVRVNRINNKEKEILQKLEDEKAFCISIGTYDVEK